MDVSEREVREQHFIEEMGLLFADMGSQRMVGRVVGRLLICDPEHQSAAELADCLGASAGSISTTTRTLLQLGLIERVAVPGERATYFRLKSDLWVDMMRIQGTVTTLTRELAERGLRLLEGQPPARRRRLQEFRDFHVFMERRMPQLLDEWIAQRRAEETG